MKVLTMNLSNLVIRRGRHHLSLDRCNDILGHVPHLFFRHFNAFDGAAAIDELLINDIFSKVQAQKKRDKKKRILCLAGSNSVLQYFRIYFISLFEKVVLFLA